MAFPAQSPTNPSADMASPLHFGLWCAHGDSGDLVGPHGSERLEPKVMELLLLLARRPMHVHSKEAIMQQLWPGIILGDDTLARAVSKLRKSLGDDVKSPRFVETLPKRGYRFIYLPTVSDVTAEAPENIRTIPAETPGQARRFFLPIALAISALMLVFAISWFFNRAEEVDRAEMQVLINRANDFYFQYTRSDNEAAVELFERVIAQRPKNSAAYAGLANAIAQRVVRWPGDAGGKTFTLLGDALDAGHTRSAAARLQLARATQLAEYAVQLAPKDAVALKALGFVKSVREDFAGALAAYTQAIQEDPDAWGPMINIADIHQISGRDSLALPYLESAFAAMTRVYPKQSARIRPWYAETAILIGERHFAEHRVDQAERWYRRALEIAPFHLKASAMLAALLRTNGREQEAVDICARLQRRIGDSFSCSHAIPDS